MQRGLAVVLLLAGCRAGPSDAPAAGPSDDPGQSFERLEATLAAANEVELRFSVKAEGAVEASVQGSARAAGPEVGLRVRGTFAGAPLDGVIMTSADGLLVRIDGNTRTAERPVDPRGALLVGLTRMGILHNVAVLSGGGGPDHADGTVRRWTTVAGFRDAGTREMDGETLSGTTFDITVDGTRVGEATLWFTPDGLPALREQVVQFPEGEMRVTERYADVRITSG